MENKVCVKCHQDKPYSEFHKTNSSKDGFAYSCKSCCSEYQKKHREANKEKYTEARREYRKTESYKETTRRHRQTPRAKQLRKESDQRLYHTDKAKLSRKRAQQKFAESGKQLEGVKRRYHGDINSRLRALIRNRVWYALKKRQKSTATMKLVGCSLDQLKQHLESLFQPGMTWDNQGKWHIDHKKPCASFDFSDPDQQKQCFHYTNLQPLWALDNTIKGSVYKGIQYKNRSTQK